MAHATLSIVDGKIRWYPNGKLSAEELETAKKVGFRWGRGDRTFMKPYSPVSEDWLKNQHGLDLEVVEEDLLKKAEDRAEYYDGYSRNANQKASDHHNTANEISQRFAMGQPILIGHHSEKRARRDQRRIWQHMSSSIAARDRASYWKDRAEATVAHAERRMKPGPTQRRIEGLEKTHKKHVVALATSFEAWWNNVGTYILRKNPTADAKRLYSLFIDRNQRWLDFDGLRLGYERQLLAAIGGLPSDAAQFEKGGAYYEYLRWYEIIRVNKKSISVATNYSWSRTVKYHEIQDSSQVMTVAQVAAAKEKGIVVMPHKKD